MKRFKNCRIHKSAIIEEGAMIDENCVVGPFCCIGSKVKLKSSVELISHVSISGDTEIGSDTKIWPFSSIGQQPQDLKFKGELTSLVIGSRNKIRESVSINPGTMGGGGITKIGNDCLFMLGSHVGHDCMVGNRVVMTNNSALAGHVILEDHVIIGGLSGIHQHCRIGEGAMIGALSMVTNDVIPFSTVMGERASLAGLNIVGLRRRGISNEEIRLIQGVYEELFEADENFKQRAERIFEKNYQSELVDIIRRFIFSDSKRSFLTPN